MTVSHTTEHRAGKVHRIVSTGGVGLHVREWGPEKGQPLLFIHGWSTNYLSWREQFDSPLRDRFRIICMDLRGHGSSDKPLDAAMYQTGELWADDVAAVITVLKLRKPILVGWSYGGFVVSDYLARHGSQNVGGVNFVGAMVISSTPPVYVGERFIDGALLAMSDDPAVMIEGVRAIVHATTLHPPPRDDLERALCAFSLTPPAVRAFLLMRTLDFSEVLRRLDRPCLITQGNEDRIVLPAMAEHIAQAVEGARLSQYWECGHAPHQEHPARFNAELAEFAEAIASA